MIGPGFPGQTLEAIADGFACGQVGTLTVTIDDGDGNNLVGPTTLDIVELECSGDNVASYRYVGVFPAENAVINWEGENIGGTVVVASETIEVEAEAPTVAAGGGPCAEWIDATDVAACCGDVEVSSDTEVALETAARSGELLAFVMSGRQFTGLCGPITVRPPGDSCANCGVQFLAYPPGASRSSRAITASGICGSCGFSALSRVLLSGYVQGIAQVKIDGEVVAPSDYRVDGHKWLVRKDDGSWPYCPNLSRDDDEVGTFSVSYYYGLAPNQLALDAAAAMACEFYRACSGGECSLPTGAIRIVRQGVTIDRLQPLAAMLRKGETGIIAWDLFIEAYGKHRRKPIFTSPSGPKYARRVGA